jgi:glutathione S-transferase
MPTNKLYYSPAALSGAASFIAAYVGGLDIEVEIVDVTQNKTFSGADFSEINPKKNIPCLITADKTVFYEEPVILTYMADQVSL